MTSKNTEAHLLNQVAAGLIDGALILVALWRWVIWQSSQDPYNILLPAVHPTLLVFILFALYRLLSLIFFNKTLGMKVTGIILLNAEEEELNWKEKFLAAFFILYRGVDYYKKKYTV